MSKVAYWWPVSYPTPWFRRDTGENVRESFEVAFKPKTPAQVDAFARAALERGIDDQRIAIELIEAWRGKVDDKGAPVPFTEANATWVAVSELCFAAAVIRAFLSYARALDPSRAHAKQTTTKQRK